MIRSDENPCYGCTERRLNCHGKTDGAYNCPQWETAERLRREKKQRESEARRNESIMRGYTTDVSHALKKKRRDRRER